MSRKTTPHDTQNMFGSRTQILHGDAREVLKNFADGSFNLIVTSPPYADARRKQYDSIAPDDFADFLLSFHEQFWRVLADDGSFVLNIKDKVVDGVRHRFVWQTVMALSERGWRCVDDYIWAKQNSMPGYWPNRLRDEWEYCFHMTKSRSFAMYQDAVKQPIGEWAEKRMANLSGKTDRARHNSDTQSGFGRDLRRWKDKSMVLPSNVLRIGLVGKNMGHPAVFPIALPSFFIKLFTRPGDSVLDPFAGSGSTGLAAEELNRHVVLIDTKPEYITLMHERLAKHRSKPRRAGIAGNKS